VPEWTAPFIRLDRVGTLASDSRAERDAALTAMACAGLSLPVVAKPDLGCRGVGVKLVRTAEDLQAYLDSFPRGAAYLLQRLVPHEGEAGVFYVRRPGQTRGRIVSITLKYFPHVIGDGKRTLRELILADPRACHTST
jgi:carbamoylphosphate synthase large subunit